MDLALMHFQLGDVATWLASVFTGFALIGTVILLILTRSELQLARRERNEVEEDRRKDQARLVSAWCIAVERGGPMDMFGARQEAAGSIVRVQYRNASDEPVYQLGITVGGDWGLSPKRARVARIGVVPPGVTGDAEIRIALEPLEPRYDVGWPPVRVQFRDCAGRAWKRGDDGRLEEYADGEMAPLAGWG